MAHARNGGHINPPLFHNFVQLKAEFGSEMAKRIINWRLSHHQELQRVAEEEGILDHSQIRDVEGLDVYCTQDKYQMEKEAYEVWKTDMPKEAEGVYCVDGDEAIEVG